MRGYGSGWRPLVLASLLVLAPAAARGDDILGHEHKCATCGHDSYGTSIVWSTTPSEAATQALKEEKLVFVLHVSGHFEDPKVT